MSTSYYALRHPIVRVDTTDGALLGVLYHLFRDDGMPAGLFLPDTLHWIADRDVKVAHRSDGVIVVTHPGPDDMQAISERGELVTLGQLRRGEAP